MEQEKHLFEVLAEERGCSVEDIRRMNCGGIRLYDIEENSGNVVELTFYKHLVIISQTGGM